MMQVDGKPKTSLLDPLWGNGFRSTNKMRSFYLVSKPKRFGKRQQEENAFSFDN